ncbi:DNA polymerase IV [Dissostichus eleginoides]|uniref:DNA polymerase IV n=1 Tax=Dissostichus eleginoides TaxID=100907 RepID=A0AAD9BVV5_DISEL|nr:DNA polymerase IV [Dissostichus eleginoides]
MEPSSETSSSSSPAPPLPRLSLRSPALQADPELLSELRESKSRSLRRVGHRTGLTTVFCGRGSQASGSAPSTQSANQKVRMHQRDDFTS